MQSDRQISSTSEYPSYSSDVTEDVGNSYWGIIASPFQAMYQYMPSVGVNVQNVPYLSTISNAVGITAKAIKSGLVYNAYSEQVMTPLVSLALEYRAYEKKQKAKGPRWIKTKELPIVYEMKKLADGLQESYEKQKKLQQTIKQQEDRLKILNEQLMHLFDIQSDSVQDKRIQLYDVIQLKKNILKQKKNELKNVEENIVTISSRLELVKKQAAVEIKQANQNLLYVATLMVDAFTKQGIEFDKFDELWPQPISDDDYDKFKISLNQFLITCGLSTTNLREQLIETLDFDKLRFLVKSRFSILQTNQQLTIEGRKEKIAVVVPVHKEFNRLKEVDECITGENFLETKCEALSWLLEGCNNIEGKIYFVDDQAPHGKPGEDIHPENASKTRVAKNKNGSVTPCIRRTIDEIDELLGESGRLRQYKDMCVCLGYEQLEKQIGEYTDKELREMSPDELANKSVKAGAVHLGLRFIADEKLADDVLLTDADNSIHLGMIGPMIQERVFKKERAVIGARRVEGSIVGNKSNDRHQMSFLFNMLNRVLLNVQVPDTQVGCKLISVDTIPEISPKMHNMTMAFDVEMIRSLQEIGVAPKSLPIYWADSPEESQSSTQANNMFKGVIEIFMKLYGYGQPGKPESLEATGKKDIHLSSFEEAYAKLIKDDEAKPALAQALKLAADPVFHFVIKHTEEIYDSLTPEIYRDFINSFSMFLTQLSEGKVDKKYILKLLNDIKTLYNNTTQSYAVGFALEKFPGIFSVLELLYRDPSYARVLAPLFLGDAMLGKKFAGMHQVLETSKPEPVVMKSFSDYCKENAINITDTNMIENFVGWQDANKIKKPDLLSPTQSVTTPVKRDAPVSKQREDAGWNKLKEDLQNPSFNKKPKKVISLVMQFDQSGALNTDKTSVTGNQYHYWNNVIKGKADALKQCLQEAGLSADDVVINLIVIDARNEDARSKDPDNLTEKMISEIIKNSNVESEMSVQCEYYDLAKHAPLTIGSKATAVRQGMRHAILDAEARQPDAVGFIDFSQKIRVQEMGALIADVASAPDDAPRAAIGTRRAYEAEVVGKRKEFLFRSMVCNHVVKAFLPELANLSDTQTGFKLFPANVLKEVLSENDASAELNVNSFAFDVQLLMRLIARGCKIDELPVVFNDNTQDIVDPDLAGPANQMFADFLIISAEEQRRKRKDFHGKQPTFSEPVFMGNGAEHVVFDCGNNMLFKIEAQHVNPNFRLILQHILFNRERLFEAAGKGGDDLFIMQFNKLLQLGMLEQWIPLLRNIPDLNRLVLGAISAWEDKTKSIDLTEVKRRGKGLVGNFTYIDQPFSTTLDGVVYNLEPRHRSKICVRAKGILQDKFVAELKKLDQSKGKLDKHIAEEVVSGLKMQVIDPALQLFENMWKRGLFDLDTNIISDLGLFQDKEDKLIVQSLDPGEMITGILNVDVTRAKLVLEKRSDILLMNAQIASIVKQLNLQPTETQQLIDYLKQEVIGYYTAQMMKFFDRIAAEKEEVAKIMERNPKLTEDEACQQASFEISYGKEWRSVDDKSEFRMEDIEYKLDPPRTDAKSYYADQDSKLLSAGYNLPYRSKETIPSAIHPVEMVEQPKYEPQIALIVPEGKEALIEKNLNSESKEGIFVHGIERGSIVPLMDFSKDFQNAQHQSGIISRSTQPETNMIFVLDAGGGTRTAGIGQQAGSKGSIKLAGKSLNDHAIKTTKMLAEQLAENGLNDCVIISSCDDLFSNDLGHMNAFVNNMTSYFNMHPSSGVNESFANPGIYWTDLPDGGKKYMPLTSQDTYEFLKNDKIKGEVKNFLLNILISRGYAEQGLVENTYGIVDQIYNTWLEFLDNESKLKTQSSNTQESMSLMGGIGALGGVLSELTSRYAKLIQWHAIQSKDEITGIKRPFLMVMKKSFFNDLNQLIDLHHDALDKVKEDITWENFLLRGLKADKTLWMIFKPKNMDSKIWEQMYAELQLLKVKHGINTEHDEQNRLRATPPVWHNLDDPYALYSAAKEMFESLSINYGSSQELPLVKVISDNVANTQKLNLSNPHDYRVELVALGSRLNGVDIEPSYLQDVLVSHQYRENILLYEIQLHPDDKFKPTMGHAHIQHEGQIYSSPIGPFTKEVLKSQPVYVYEKDHQDCLVAKPLLNSKQERVTLATFADYLKSVPTMPVIKPDVRLEAVVETTTATTIKTSASQLRQLSMFSNSVTAETDLKPELISLLSEYAKQKEPGKSVSTEVKVILANAVLPNLLTTKWPDNTMPMDAKIVSHAVEQEMLKIMKTAESSFHQIKFDTASKDLLIRAAKAQMEDTINRYNKLGAEGKYKDFDILVLRCAGKLNDAPLQSKKWSK